MLTLFFQAAANTQAAEGTHELIILFDVSTSMSWNDTSFLAPDALQQIVHTLPTHWHVGIVTFNGVVVDYVAPGAYTTAEVQQVLNQARYTNWTNSGAGFAQVLELFSNHAQNRTIIFMTDGELAHLPTAQETAEATAHAEQMIAEIIASDIIVHTIAVGQDFPEVHESVMGLAAATGGTLLLAPTSGELNAVAAKLVMDTFMPTQNQVGAATQMQQPNAGRFMIALPQDTLDYAKILIHADAAISHVVVSASAESIHIETGARFALVKLTQPTQQSVQIDFVTDGTSTASLILPVNAAAVTEIDTDLPDNLVDILPGDGAEMQTEAPINADTLPGQNTQIQAGITRQNFAISVLVVLTFLILFTLLFHIRGKDKAAANSPYAFTGKLDVYITPQNSKVQQAYAVRLGKKGQYSLRDVLQKCRAPGVFSATQQMYFSTDKYGALQITNESEHAVLVKSKVLEKGESHTLAYGENVRVNLEDGALLISPRLLYRVQR